MRCDAALDDDKNRGTSIVTDFNSMNLSRVLNDLPAAESRALSVCFVTPELTQFHLNGGIGTAVSGLIEVLNMAGHRVSVLYTGWAPSEDEPENNHPRWYAGLKQLQSAGIDVVFVSRIYGPSLSPSGRGGSYACFDYLKGRNFDVIHFVDYGGSGYYSCLAKRCGVAFPKTTLVTTVHGPTLWASQADLNPLVNVYQYEQTVLEHKAIANSDICVGLSDQLLTWLIENKVDLPKRTYLHKNCHPHLPQGTRRKIVPHGLKRIAFFGRLDQRKGVDLYVDGVKQFLSRHPEIEVYFVGRFSNIDGEHSAGYVLNKLKTLSNRIRFLHQVDRDAALRVLGEPGTLAVMPSHEENSPCVVVECQTAGIPFLATAVGGIPELVREEDQARVLISPTPAALTKRLDDIWANGHAAAEVRDAADEVADAWLRFHSYIAAELNDNDDRQESAALPLVSVCITHYRRPHLLRGLLSAIEKQTYPNIEILLVDDGSDELATRSMLDRLRQDVARTRPLKIIEIENSYLGAARNAAAANASGEYLKFQDDDNSPLPYEIEKLVKAAQSQSADVVTCFSYVFRGKPPEDPTVANVEYFPLGDCAGLSYIRNDFGDANALVRTSAFSELGGFSTDRGVGCEDYEFFARIVSCGKKLVCVPEPLFFYRVAPDSMLQQGSVYKNAMRARRGFAQMPPSYLSIYQDLELGRQINEQQRAVAWDRVGQYEHAWLHHQLMADDPNGDANSKRVCDLLGRYGRVEDAIRFMMDHYSVAAGLEWVSERSKTFISQRNGQAHEAAHSIFLDFREDQGVKLLSPHWNQLPPTWNIDWEIVGLRTQGLLVHPVGSEITVVCKPRAIPRSTRRIIVRWLHTNSEGGLAEVSVQVGVDSAFASDWIQLCASDGPIDIVVEVPPLEQPADLFFRSRALGSDANVWTCVQSVKIDVDNSPN